MMQYYLILFACVVVLCVVVIRQSIGAAKARRTIKRLNEERNKYFDRWIDGSYSLNRDTAYMKTNRPNEFYMRKYDKHPWCEVFAEYDIEGKGKRIFLVKSFTDDDEEYNENCANELLEYLTK
jgi:hypothetical protein